MTDEWKKHGIKKQIEYSIFNKVDVIMTPSSAEASILHSKLKNKRVEVIPLIIYENDYKIDKVIPFNERRDIIYLGGFSHTPNVDAVLWFVNEIFPVILNKIPDIKFIILGSNPPQNIKALESEKITIQDAIDRLLEDYNRKRFFEELNNSIIRYQKSNPKGWAEDQKERNNMDIVQDMEDEDETW